MPMANPLRNILIPFAAIAYAWAAIGRKPHAAQETAHLGTGV
jgi:hypothetical protein